MTIELFWETIKPYLRRIYLRKYNIILFPFYIPAAICFYLAGVRVINLNYTRIGHLVVEPEIYQKKRILGQLPWHLTLIFAPVKKVANKHILQYINHLKKLKVLTSSFSCFLFQTFWLFPFLRVRTNDYAIADKKTSEWATIASIWDNRPPILTLTNEDKEFGKAMLEKMGLPKDAWFICIHVREGGYSPHDEKYHSFRNADIHSFVSTIDLIHRKGGYCIRMGDASMTRMPNIEGLIDYAHSDFRSDRMDVIICGGCRFFLGTASGLLHLASIFGVPVALTNLAPISMALPSSSCDRSIFKLYASRDDGLLKFNEIFANESSNYRHSEDFSKNGISLIDNSSDEIEMICEEMLALTSKNSTYINFDNKEEELQQKFKQIMKPGHYTYGAPGRVCNSFLEKYEDLLI
jgi:putative glycosyltransferase (TIGR04372 family)